MTLPSPPPDPKFIRLVFCKPIPLAKIPSSEAKSGPPLNVDGGRFANTRPKKAEPKKEAGPKKCSISITVTSPSGKSVLPLFGAGKRRRPSPQQQNLSFLQKPPVSFKSKDNVMSRMTLLEKISKMFPKLDEMKDGPPFSTRPKGIERDNTSK